MQCPEALYAFDSSGCEREGDRDTDTERERERERERDLRVILNVALFYNWALFEIWVIYF